MSDKCSEKYYAVKGRPVFHRPECRFISGYDKCRLTEVAVYGRGIIMGMTPCNRCRPRADSTSAADISGVEAFCRKHGIVCLPDSGSIVIITCAARWRIYPANGIFVLHHEIWTFRGGKFGKRAGFIVRDKEFDDITEAVFYAYCHDKRYRRPQSAAEKSADMHI